MVFYLPLIHVLSTEVVGRFGLKEATPVLSSSLCHFSVWTFTRRDGEIPILVGTEVFSLCPRHSVHWRPKWPYGDFQGPLSTETIRAKRQVSVHSETLGSPCICSAWLHPEVFADSQGVMTLLHSVSFFSNRPVGRVHCTCSRRENSSSPKQKELGSYWDCPSIPPFTYGNSSSSPTQGEFTQSPSSPAVGSQQVHTWSDRLAQEVQGRAHSQVPSGLPRLILKVWSLSLVPIQ